MYMPTKDNLKNSLIELLEENSMDKITVKMVADRAGVSRQAVYNHYGNLMEVLQDAFQADLARALKEVDTYERWVDALRETLQMFLDRKRIILHVYRSSYCDEFMRMLAQEEAGRIETGIRQCEEMLGMEMTSEERSFMQRAYLDMLMGVFDRFFARDMKDDPNEIARYYEMVMGESIKNALVRKLCVARTRQRPAGVSGFDRRKAQ